MFDSSPSLANPFRPPDWRWQRAKMLVQLKKRPRGDSDDAFTKTVRRYASIKAKCKEDLDFMELEGKFPGIFWAEQIYSNQAHDTRWAIEARLLANEKLESIADKVSTTTETVLWYERVFFNVLPHLRKPDYIACVVMGRAIHAGLHERDYDLFWKMLGYSYGPKMLDTIILPFVNPMHVTGADQIEAAWDDLYVSTLSKKAAISAMTVPTAYNQCNIMQLYNELKRLEKDSGGGSIAFSSISNNVYAALSQLPFHSGTNDHKTVVDGRPVVDVPALPYYDDQSAELRSSEMVAVALGQDTPNLREIVRIKMPETSNVANPEQDQ
jgi:hypothetical protein